MSDWRRCLYLWRLKNKRGVRGQFSYRQLRIQGARVSILWSELLIHEFAWMKGNYPKLFCAAHNPPLYMDKSSFSMHSRMTSFQYNSYLHRPVSTCFWQAKSIPLTWWYNFLPNPPPVPTRGLNTCSRCSIPSMENSDPVMTAMISVYFYGSRREMVRICS